VILFDNFRRDSLAHTPDLRAHPRLRIVKGDVLAPGDLAAAFAGVDTVLHLAAVAGVSSYYREPLLTLRVNIQGTLNVLDAAVWAGVRRLVYFSTSEIFGPRASAVTEESPSSLGPLSDARWVYAISKLAGEQLVLRTGQTHGLAATVLRPFNVYGPRQTGEGAISNFCAAAAEGRPLTVYGEGTATRSWCYVSDMVDAVEATLRTREASGEAFNIGNPSAVETTVGLAERVMQLVPGARYEFQPVQRQEVLARTPVIDKARSVLGFEPKVNLDEGLRLTLDWFRRSRQAG
jgi:UDP-glucose 4-epimerase